MTNREERAHRREQQRVRVDNIECHSAKSLGQCEQLKNELLRLFY